MENYGSLAQLHSTIKKYYQYIIYADKPFIVPYPFFLFLFNFFPCLTLFIKKVAFVVVMSWGWAQRALAAANFVACLCREVPQTYFWITYLYIGPVPGGRYIFKMHNINSCNVKHIWLLENHYRTVIVGLYLVSTHPILLFA